MVKRVLVFLLLMDSLGVSAQDIAFQSILPWSARYLQSTPSVWRDQDLPQTLGTPGSNLLAQALDLKNKNNLRCGNYSSVMENRIASLGQKLVTTRFMYNTVSQTMTLDVFVKEGDEYKEILRSSYGVYHGRENSGRLRQVSMLDPADASTISMGMLNSEILTFFNQRLGGSEGRVETNSPIGRDILTLLAETESGFVCCFNRSCRQHMETSRPAPTPVAPATNGETRTAEAQR